MAKKSQVEEGHWGGPWSELKLKKVEEYLKAYLKVMKNNAPQYGWTLVYIDAFSGRGHQNITTGHEGQPDLGGEEASGFIVGSTMRALKATQEARKNGDPGFSCFDFLDKDQSALQELRTSVEDEYPRLLDRCRFICGDANEELPEILSAHDWSRSRGVIFIDPYGASFTKTLLEKVANTYALDVWVLFPLSAIGRMMAKDSNGISNGVGERLDAFFGSHEWYERLYFEEEQPTLFGEVDTHAVRKEGYDELLRYTKEWLEGIFGENNVLNPLRLDLRNGAPIFALVAAISSKSPKAISAWRRIAGSLLDNA